MKVSDKYILILDIYIRNRTDGEVLETDFKKAEHFNKYFASVNKKKDLDIGLNSVLKSKEKDRMSPAIFQEPLTESELNSAIKKLKRRKAQGLTRCKTRCSSILGIRAG